jgi:hypothetical protein
MINVGQPKVFEEALTSAVDQQQRSLAGGQTPRDLVREVDVTGRVDQVEEVRLAVRVLIDHRDRLSLDCDASFPFDLELVQDCEEKGAAS